MEIHFWISLEPCPTCRRPLDPDRFRLSADVGTGVAYSGSCAGCGFRLGFSFLATELLRAPMGAWDELGAGRTEILAPSKLAAELERLAPGITDDPTGLDVAAWKTNRDANVRALRCANELYKLLDEGADTIADALLDADERACRAAHPSWYARGWIERHRARHKAVVAANIADLPRVNAMGPPFRPRPGSRRWRKP